MYPHFYVYTRSYVHTVCLYELPSVKTDLYVRIMWRHLRMEGMTRVKREGKRHVDNSALRFVRRQVRRNVLHEFCFRVSGLYEDIFFELWDVSVTLFGGAKLPIQDATCGTICMYVSVCLRVSILDLERDGNACFS